MSDTPLTVSDARLVRLLVVSIEGIVGGVAAWSVYFGLRQAYLSVMILLRPELSLRAQYGDPTTLGVFWLAIGFSIVAPIALGGAGLYAVCSRKLWRWLGVEFHTPIGSRGVRSTWGLVVGMLIVAGAIVWQPGVLGLLSGPPSQDIGVRFVACVGSIAIGLYVSNRIKGRSHRETIRHFHGISRQLKERGASALSIGGDE